MKSAGAGLTEVTTQDLKKLLQAIYQEHIVQPLTIVDLTRVGLQHCATLLLPSLRNLAPNAIQAVLVNVLAERNKKL